MSLDPTALRAHRDRVGLTQEALAEAIGAHASFISQLERGVKRPAFGTVEAIAGALGLQPCDICVTVRAGRS